MTPTFDGEFFDTFLGGFFSRFFGIFFLDLYFSTELKPHTGEAQSMERWLK